jgi:putative sigma-54 modulation protein
MRVGFTGKSVGLGDREREYAQKKLQRLARHFNTAREAQLAHKLERNRHHVEVQVDLNGIILRGEARHGDPLQAIDEVADKLEEQLRRLKDKLRSHKGRASATAVASALTELPEEMAEAGSAEPLPGVVRRKRFHVKPMSVEEAALQMELLNHDFFAFVSAETGEPNVLYRRKDGDYGLLELEV